MELHPEYGHEIVRGIGFLDEARDAILHHHERLDGSGYPYGLSGSRIPEFARVVAVADAFDAMTSTRSYRRARPVPAALAELKRCAGSQFDPGWWRRWTVPCAGTAGARPTPPSRPTNRASRTYRVSRRARVSRSRGPAPLASRTVRGGRGPPGRAPRCRAPERRSLSGPSRDRRR